MTRNDLYRPSLTPTVYAKGTPKRHFLSLRESRASYFFRLVEDRVADDLPLQKSSTCLVASA